VIAHGPPTRTIGSIIARLPDDFIVFLLDEKRIGNAVVPSAMPAHASMPENNMSADQDSPVSSEDPLANRGYNVEVEPWVGPTSYWLRWSY
jgi:hypothetical protein